LFWKKKKEKLKEQKKKKKETKEGMIRSQELTNAVTTAIPQSQAELLQNHASLVAIAQYFSSGFKFIYIFNHN
jgi:hypothetical protein